MASYPVQGQAVERSAVVLEYRPQPPDKGYGYSSPQQSQGMLMQNSPVLQNGYPIDGQGSQTTYSPYTPQQNLMVHNQYPQHHIPDLKPEIPAARMDPGATPRLESALKCLYATLSFSIPIYILHLTTFFEPLGSFWLSPLNLMFTLIFSSTVVMVTFRDRARMHPNSTKPPPKLPALCRLPTIIFCFLIAILWIAAAGVMIFNMVFLASFTVGYDSFGSSSGSLLGALTGVATIIGGIEAVCAIAQIGLLMAVGILGAVERKHAKRYLKAGST